MDDHGGGLLAVIKVEGNGKRRFDPAAKERLIDACQEPGVSVARLALEHGVNANLLRNWIRLRRRKAQRAWPVTKAASAPSFIPVIEAVSGPASSAGSGVLAIQGEAGAGRDRETRRSPSQARVKAALPNGVTLTLDCGDAKMVSALIEALGRCNVPAGR